jgi:SOS-response transcriptional repressor LexA
MDKLTGKQQQTLMVIARLTTQRGTPPTFVELREELGIKSNQSLIDRILLLERKELLARSPGQRRSIILKPKAAEYFHSLGDYTMSPPSLAISEQTLGTFVDNKSATRLGDGGSFTGGTVLSDIIFNQN